MTCRIGRPPKHPPEVMQQMVREYRQHVLRRTLPAGWVKQKAAELGMIDQTIYKYIQIASQEPPPVPVPVPVDRSIAPRSHFDHSAAMRGGGRANVIHASKWEMD